MKTLLTTLGLFVVFMTTPLLSQAAGEVVYNHNNQTFVVPEKKKLVVVPHWWDEKKIVYLYFNAHAVVFSDEVFSATPVECQGIPELDFSPLPTYPSYCREYYPECPEGLQVSPSTQPAYCSLIED